MAIFEACNNAMWEQYGCSDWDMEYYCWANNYWTWQYLEDPDTGELLDEQRVITTKDIQEACDDLGLDFDVLNY